MKNIEKKIKKIVAQQLGLKKEEITNQSSFLNDLGADSLDIIELIMAFEEEFNIEISDEDAEKMISIDSVLKFVKKIK